MEIMAGDTLRHAFTVTNPQGWHMRPMTSFVEAACRYASDVTVSKAGHEPANGKSLLALMGLAAEQGTELIIEVKGADAREALATLSTVLQRSYPEDEA